MFSNTNWAELGRTLHARLSAGDDLVVTSEIVELFLPPLVNGLRRRFFNVPDEDLWSNAATDALLHYFAAPDRYQPDRGPLLPWLRTCAIRNLLDELKRQKNRRAHEEAVELADLEAVYQTAAEAEEALIARHSNEATWARLRAVLADPLDLQLAALMMDNVRDTAVFAAALGIADKTGEEQQQLVKRHKDRIKKTIQRHYRVEK